jgi:hypothetical protein
MRELGPDTYDTDYALLTETPIRINAQHVTDEWSDLPLLYPLDEATSAEDIGARYSLVLGDQLPGMAMDPELCDRYATAAARFAEAVNHPAARFVHPLRAGQVILLDNNRFGHGRPRCRRPPATSAMRARLIGNTNDAPSTRRTTPPRTYPRGDRAGSRGPRHVRGAGEDPLSIGPGRPHARGPVQEARRAP